MGQIHGSGAIPIHDVQTSILIFQVELLNKLLNKEPKVEEPEVFLKNEGKEDD